MANIPKKERAEFTKKYLAEKHEEVIIEPLCTCSEKELPHKAHTEEKGIFEYHQSLRYKREKGPKVHG